MDLDTLLATSDVISLSLAYTPATHHFLGRAEFAKMKRGVTLVNTARGPLVDEAALMDALGAGIVWSAGLDVFEQEPSTNTRLLQDQRVFCAATHGRRHARHVRRDGGPGIGQPAVGVDGGWLVDAGS